MRYYWSVRLRVHTCATRVLYGASVRTFERTQFCQHFIKEINLLLFHCWLIEALGNSAMISVLLRS